MHCRRPSETERMSRSFGSSSAWGMAASEIESSRSQRPAARKNSELPPAKQPRKERETMTYVDHPVQAHTASIAGRGPYSRVEQGVRVQFQSFSSSVSVLWRIMLGSQQDPTTARTRRRLRL